MRYCVSARVDERLKLVAAAGVPVGAAGSAGFFPKRYESRRSGVAGGGERSLLGDVLAEVLGSGQVGGKLCVNGVK